ncbi:MAG: tripartite tricarboxylate transporter substrate binding protein [Achromobacter sp.]|uniref:Bug family tripartite tricarboxylate transporter substrate binding protein n=1 Tax=Achromobacter sp. TaxID=134375 RepID=UPI00258A2067|nr:tripartite tricarboxylate transporter substrate binding protein [Achromobacter sp.]MCW0207959.1 tripartite tricarboxylate transporter substrate binding protein [Achromobacter sp.]
MKKTILGASLALASLGAAAETFPSQPMTLIVPYTAGGSSDALARALGKAIAKNTGASIVVENRPGGSTVIGAQALLGKPADGYTVMLAAASFVINPYLLNQLPYDSVKDFQPVAQLATNPHVLVVGPKVPVGDLKAFLAWAREQGDKATFSSFGNGSSGHLGFEMLKKQAGLAMMHVPYKGSAPATMAVLSGEVDATLGDVGVVAPHIQAGKLRALAVAGNARTPALPDVPTFAEAGLPGFESQTWMGLLTRAGVPAERVQRLNQMYSEALQDADVRQILAQQGMVAAASSPEAFSAFMKAESAKYGQAVKDGNVRID